MRRTGEDRCSGDTESMMATFRERCRAAGLRITPQRLAVYQALIETDEHPSAEAVYRTVRDKLPNISLDTVNRTLLTMRDIEAAFVVEGTGDAKRFDANLGEHQHFKCIRCKRIVDFCHEPFENIPTPEAIGRKYKVLRKTVYLEGICDLCGG